MRNLLTIVLLGTVSITMANIGKYEEAMLKNIEALYKSKSLEEYQKVINTMDRIATAEADKWEPYYYGSFGNIMMSTRVTELADKDKLLDAAQHRLDKASAIQAGNVEIITLQGFIHMMRLAADPATRGQQYAGLAFETFNKAVAIDSLNPRALIMRAQMMQGTAKFFGTSMTESCGEAQKALDQFDSSEKPKNPLAPIWGRGNAVGMLKECDDNE